MTSPLTRAERTRYAETSRHADVLAFLGELEARKDPRIFRTSFGTSPEGRELPLLVLSARGIKTPIAARASGKPVVLVVLSGAMHAAGHSFYRSANGVWLTDHVPTEFLEIP